MTPGLSSVEAQRRLRVGLLRLLFRRRPRKGIRIRRVSP